MADGTEVGLGEDRLLGCWWMRIKAEDYLERGNDALGFYGKLKKYLQSQNVDDAEWSYGYLVTAPGFLGYAFNPVSFWYVYDSDHQLTRMIVEVNNIFGERRMYMLDGSNVVNTPAMTDLEMSGLELPVSGKSRFTDIWMKDFHVSPFNSRKGSYVLKASNPFPHASYDNPVIDNTITLISSKDYAKLVARLNSTGEALDPNQLGVVSTMRFVLSWWWVGFMTLPRFGKEAWKLFLKRNLHVWHRPEVLHTGIGRIPTPTEMELYKVFKDYMFLLVHQSQQPFSITLHTAIPTESTQTIATTHQPARNRETRKLEITVLTPAFYSRFVHYAHTSEAFDRECIFTDEKNRTLWVSQPQLLAVLINESRHVEAGSGVVVKRSYFHELRWKLIKKLRCAPALPADAVSTPSNAEATAEDVRSLPYSELDLYVRSFRGRVWAKEYRRIVTKLFLAQRFGLGFAEVIDLLDFAVRALLCCLAVLQMVNWRYRSEQRNVAGWSMRMLLEGTSKECYKNVMETHGDWWWLVGAAASLSAGHMYEISKERIAQLLSFFSKADVQI
ncbi:hypothetical protein CC86DRAFT_341260 [Ophiobolus disseminans]|uniref:DUF1365-domain-containing protein n=1 Tax=Ophiobolus disseminans TaxID=1469910 RepID=A0A6A7AH54_9PLEO|nr:hypothetical protein CC86DRAFT_341260 [Ophiobolus disseminans]